MSLGICFPQLRERRMRIDFGRLQTFMPQQSSHTFQPRPMVEHGGRKGMPEHMGRTLLQRADQRQMLFHEIPDLAGFIRSPFLVRKNAGDSRTTWSPRRFK